MKKLKFMLLIISTLWLCACPAPESDHVIINESNGALEVEYEYAVRAVKHDTSRLDDPAKMTFAEYEANAGSRKKWQDLTAENEYKIEPGAEETITNPQTNQSYKQQIKIVRIKLLPGEVLRVFVSAHINYDLKNIIRISLKGERGRLEIEGAGFEQFAKHRPARFFTDTEDYRIAYK